MIELIWFLTGVAFALAMSGLFRSYQRRNAAQRRRDSAAVLKKHGLEERLYVPSIGVDGVELRNALDEFAYSGRIILNARDEVVGRICPTVMKGPQLRLVVSND